MFIFLGVFMYVLNNDPAQNVERPFQSLCDNISGTENLWLLSHESLRVVVYYIREYTQHNASAHDEPKESRN